MKTPTTTSAKAAAVTPEEVKDRVAVKHEFKSWIDMLIHQNTFSSILKYENEAMQDYAEALYKERIEKAGLDIPDKNKFVSWEKEESEYKYVTAEDTYEWMKEQSSVVVAKERDKYNELKDEMKQWEIDHFHDELRLEQKDKEIVELNSETRLTKINFWNRLKAFVSEVNVNDPGSEEDKEMILNICNEKIINTITKTK